MQHRVETELKVWCPVDYTRAYMINELLRKYAIENRNGKSAVLLLAASILTLRRGRVSRDSFVFVASAVIQLGRGENIRRAPISNTWSIRPQLAISK